MCIRVSHNCTTSAEGESIGNSWTFSHLVEAFSTQWGDAALAARDAKAKKSEAFLQQLLTILTCLDSPRLLALNMQFHGTTRIHRLLSLKMMTMTTTKNTLTGTLVTVKLGWMTLHTQLVLRQIDDQELLEQFDGNLEDADASASQVYASASRSFQEARELLARVKSARGYFHVVGIGASDGLAQPSTDRKPAKSRGKGKKEERKTLFPERWKTDKPGYT